MLKTLSTVPDKSRLLCAVLFGQLLDLKRYLKEEFCPLMVLNPMLMVEGGTGVCNNRR